mgnify:CR=1 FL=1
MRRNKTLTLKEVLNDLIREYRIGPKLREASIINIWDEVTGKAISSRTSKIYIRDGVLHVFLTSSVVKNELMMLREELREQLNMKAGEEVVREIVIH